MKLLIEMGHEHWQQWHRRDICLSLFIVSTLGLVPLGHFRLNTCTFGVVSQKPPNLQILSELFGNHGKRDSDEF